MAITNRIKSAYQSFVHPTTNSAPLRAARDFLRYGDNKLMTPDWSQTVMSEQDLYTGFMYGALDIRAVNVTKLATNNLHTSATPQVAKQAKDKGEEITHPYLTLIDESIDFSNYQFWYNNATWLDMRGIVYILAVRAVSNGMVGKVQQFKLMNPYFVERIFDKSNKELIGYKEYNNGRVRDIPKEMVIAVPKLNPTSQTELWSMTDAAKDSQFTLKTANDYTRSAIRNNINAPGLISTDRELEGQDAINFKQRVMGKVKGEPIFGFGAGAMKWEDMQNDLNKAALGEVNNISLQNIVAVSGASKTMLGWEESGTTRDTAKVQKDNFTENRAMPLLQNLIDGLNQDYKTYYPTDYKNSKYKIYIENPLGVDREAELKAIEVREKAYEVYSILVAKGYDRELAAKYADGKVTLEELGNPTNEPEPEEIPANQAVITIKQNEAESGLLDQNQAALQNNITNIDNRMLATIVNRVGASTNDFEERKDIITERERKAFLNELEIALAAFYGIIIPLYATSVLAKRLEVFGKSTQFRMNNNVRSFIKNIAAKASTSHVDTITNDILKFARSEALKGTPRDQIAMQIRTKYGGEIAKSRAVAIARTETNRAFTMSQYQADLQFVKQGGFEGRAYKQWVTRSDNPCPFCQAMAEQPPIPLDQPFAQVGDELTATTQVDGKSMVRKMTMTFADADAGNLHVNCGCSYELIIE